MTKHNVEIDDTSGSIATIGNLTNTSTYLVISNAIHFYYYVFRKILGGYNIYIEKDGTYKQIDIVPFKKIIEERK